MNWEKLFPGRFLKSGEFDGREPTLTIVGIALEDLPETETTKKRKGIISFKETTKLLALNKTNGVCMKAMFGTETDAWIGKRVTFWAEPYDGETAIRVRGSPDIAGPLAFTAKVGLKNRKFKLAKTTGVNGPPAANGKPAIQAPTKSDADEDAADAAFMQEAQS